MTIGFDFDKVFIDYPPFIPYALVDFLYKGSTIFRKNSKKNNFLHYRFPGLFEQKIRILSHHTLFRPPIKSNITILKKISDKKNGKTYLVSSRFGFLKKQTNTLLEKYKLNKYFDGIYFNYGNRQPHIFKEQTIRKLKLDIYIDDDLDLSFYLSKKIPELTIFWVRDGRKKVTSLPSNIIPIKDLKELNKYLDKK